MREAILLFINGERHELAGKEAAMMLADYLRYQRGLTGTKIVCAEGDCGACSVLRFFPGVGPGVGAKKAGRSSRYLPINSCITPCAQLDGSSLITVEGIGTPESLHPVQEAMLKCHGSQCGFCTPGFVVALAGLVEKKKDQKKSKKEGISFEEAKNATTGNLCRCTGYQQILESARQVKPSACESLRERYLPAGQEKELREALKKPLHIKGEGFEFYAPLTLKQAVAYLAKEKSAVLLSAATDLGVAKNKGKAELAKLLSLHLIPGLYECRISKQEALIGARVNLAEVRKKLLKAAPEFARFLDLFASPQIKNIATLIGNLANASPIADTPPFLLLSDAVVETISKKGKRKIPLRDFYLGYRKTALRSGELIVGVRFGLPSARDRWALYKSSERRDLDISTVNAGFLVRQGKGGGIEKARLALGGVAATPLRLLKTEALLEGEVPSLGLLERALDSVQKEIDPLSDLRGSAAFRRLLAENFVRKFFREQLGVRA